MVFVLKVLTRYLIVVLGCAGQQLQNLVTVLLRSPSFHVF